MSERERERQTDRQTDRQPDREREIQAERERQTESLNTRVDTSHTYIYWKKNEGHISDNGLCKNL